MNPKVAYAIAAAVELKTGLHINLQSDGTLWTWMVDESGFSVMRNTVMTPQQVAQQCLDHFKPLIPTYKIRKRRDND